MKASLIVAETALLFLVCLAGFGAVQTDFKAVEEVSAAIKVGGVFAIVATLLFLFSKP